MLTEVQTFVIKSDVICNYQLYTFLNVLFLKELFIFPFLTFGNAFNFDIDY